MGRATKICLTVAVGIFGLAIASLTVMVRHGFSARDQPTALEAFVARRMRLLAIPESAREMTNPIAEATDGVLADARAHFADHCAGCHANDGSGDTPIGRNLYPKAPDMRKPETQSMTDGELFFIIHNGIRLTGMPAWGGNVPGEDQDSWKLVHFIRHLPHLSADEIAAMRALNPRGPHERKEEEEIDSFLRGDDAPVAPTHHH